MFAFYPKETSARLLICDVVMYRVGIVCFKLFLSIPIYCYYSMENSRRSVFRYYFGIIFGLFVILWCLAGKHEGISNTRKKKHSRIIQKHVILNFNTFCWFDKIVFNKQSYQKAAYWNKRINGIWFRKWFLWSTRYSC